MISKTKMVCKRMHPFFESLSLRYSYADESESSLDLMTVYRLTIFTPYRNVDTKSPQHIIASTLWPNRPDFGLNGLGRMCWLDYVLL